MTYAVRRRILFHLKFFIPINHKRFELQKRHSTILGETYQLYKIFSARHHYWDEVMHFIVCRKKIAAPFLFVVRHSFPIQYHSGLREHYMYQSITCIQSWWTSSLYNVAWNIIMIDYYLENTVTVFRRQYGCSHQQICLLLRRCSMYFFQCTFFSKLFW